jgi:peptidoglycan hydrolase-like protein with peptidoglycan-binding domain
MCTPFAAAGTANRHASRVASAQHTKKISHAQAKSKSLQSKSKSTTSRRKSGRARTKPAKPRGQQAIASDRVREIQEALIRVKYMDGQPNGMWDDTTKQALVRFQGDNGWQTKIVPDSRALIKLGLGPDRSRNINQPMVESSSNVERPGGTNQQ